MARLKPSHWRRIPAFRWRCNGIPEWRASEDATSQKIFAAFGTACQQWRAARSAA